MTDFTKGLNKYNSTGADIGSSSGGLDTGGLAGAAYVGIAFAQASLINNNLNVAQAYYNTNLTDFNFFQTTYEPAMANTLSEAMNRPVYSNVSGWLPQYGRLDYLASIGRGASVAARKLDQQWFMTRKRTHRYHTGLAKYMDYKFTMAAFQETLNGWNVGFRYEDRRWNLYDEQRHAHQTEILNIGIGVGNAARQGLASSVQALSEERGKFASEIGSIGNGLAAHMEYNKTTKALNHSSISDVASNTALANKGFYNQNNFGNNPSVGADNG